MAEESVSVPADRDVVAHEMRDRLDARDVLLVHDLLGAGAPLSDPALRECQARALEALGRRADAMGILQELLEDGRAGEETPGLFAAMTKRAALDEADADDRRSGLEAARALYARAHAESGGFWSRVNLATLAFVLGDEPTARAHAEAVCADVEARLVVGERDPWLPGTLGEARLVLGDMAASREAYERLAAETRRTWQLDRLRSARDNLRMLVDHGADGADLLSTVVRMPRVAVLVGHATDRPGTPARLPAARLPALRARLSSILDEHDVGHGFSGLAPGADHTFQSLLAERHMPRTVVLPWDAKRYARDNAAWGADPAWTQAFGDLCAGATQRIEASEHPFRTRGLGLRHAVEVLDGSACLRAADLGAEVLRIAVWDGEAPRVRGATRALAAAWREAGHDDVLWVRPQALDEAPSSAAALWSRVAALDRPTPPDDEQPAEVLSLLFADAEGFSTLDEDQGRAFVRGFLGVVADALRPFEAAIRVRNTWGDGIFLVIDGVAEAGRVALAICDATESAQAAGGLGLPQSIRLRVALHTAPVHVVEDPITGRTRVAGAHVSHPARIEPRTRVGEVWASEAFAALSALDPAARHRCTYVGRMQLAKRGAVRPVYRVVRV